MPGLLVSTATATAAVLFAAAALAAPPQKLGPEFRVNQTTAGRMPSVSALRDGGFVVTWGGSQNVDGRRYNASGAATTNEFRIRRDEIDNTEESCPCAVAGLSNGGFAVAWEGVVRGENAEGTPFVHSLIIYDWFTAGGVRFGARELRQGRGGNRNFQNPTLTGVKDGSFVLAWSGGGDFSDDIYIRRIIAATGDAVTTGFANTRMTRQQLHPAVASMNTGRYVAVWDTPYDASTIGVSGQLYSADDAAIGSEFPANTFSRGTQQTPAVGALPGGGFVVVWQSAGQDGSGAGIYGQRYNANGVRAGGEFRINVTTASDQNEPSVAGLSGGGFVVTWTSAGNQDGSGKGVFGRIYNAAGVAPAGEFRVNTYTFSTQSDSSVASLPNNQFVVVWSSYGQDGDGLGVYGQRFRVP